MTTQPATVNAINLTQDERTRASKADKSRERDAARTTAETAAATVVKNYKILVDILIQHEEARKKFTEVAKEFRHEFQVVRDYFAHKPARELFLGEYRTGDEWSQAELGATYRHFCDCNPKPLAAAKPLLVENTDSKTAVDEAETSIGGGDETPMDWRAALEALPKAIADSLGIPTKSVGVRKLGGNYIRPFEVVCRFKTPQEIKRVLCNAKRK